MMNDPLRGTIQIPGETPRIQEAAMMRCAVFIDGNNIFHSARQLGFEVDYSRLLSLLVGRDRELLRAFFYTGVDETADRQRGFLHWMRRNGFRVVQKPVKLERDGTRRARLEVEMPTTATNDTAPEVVTYGCRGGTACPGRRRACSPDLRLA